MKASIRDRASLGSLLPVDIRAYLKSRGWEQVANWPGRASIHSLKSDTSETVVKVPVSRGLADFASVAQEIVAQIADAEERSELSVFRDLSEVGSDIIRVRSFSADSTGTIELAQGVALFEQSKALLTSAARSIQLGPRAIYRGRPPSEVGDYLRDVRLGQTEIGSFVITLLSPVPVSIDTMLDDAWDPFERRVVKQLSRALTSAGEAVSDALMTESLIPFEKAIEDGVSANFCTALSEMVAENQEVEISMSLSPRRPTATHVAKHYFETETADVLRQVAKHFRDTKPRLNELIEGMVMSIGADQPQETYEVKLAADFEGRIRPITGLFGRNDYDALSAALKNSAPVSFIGDVIPEAGGWRVQNHKDLFVRQQLQTYFE